MRYYTIPLLILVFAVVSFTAVAAQPVGLSAGPVVQLKGLTGPNFDRQYIRSMYQHFSDIAGLTTQGISRTTSKDLRDISIKIRDEQTAKNKKLALWASQVGIRSLPVSYTHIQRLENNLARYRGRQYDVQYARTLIGMLQQSRTAATLALSRATMPDLRDQAKITVSSATNEINALNSWLNRPASVKTR